MVFIIPGVLLPELLISLLMLSIGADSFASICQSALVVDSPTKDCAPPLAAGAAQLIGLGFLRRSNFVPALRNLLNVVNHFNRQAPGWEREDNEAVGWPGVIGKFSIQEA